MSTTKYTKQIQGQGHFVKIYAARGTDFATFWCGNCDLFCNYSISTVCFSLLHSIPHVTASLSDCLLYLYRYTCMRISVNYSLMKANVGCQNV